MIRALGVALALVAAPAHAAVTVSSEAGFVVRHEATLPGKTPAEAYARLLALSDWWDGAHTYSGDARNLSLKAKPGGCWCEKLDGGGFVEHGRVVLARPGAQLTVKAALGPVLQSGDGVLTYTIKESPEGARVTMTYTVYGVGVGAFAGPVDTVMGAAHARYAGVGP